MGPDNNKLGLRLQNDGWHLLDGHETYFTDKNTNPVSIFVREFKQGENIVIPALGDFSILKKR